MASATKCQPAGWKVMLNGSQGLQPAEIKRGKEQRGRQVEPLLWICQVSAVHPLIIAIFTVRWI